MRTKLECQYFISFDTILVDRLQNLKYLQSKLQDYLGDRDNHLKKLNLCKYHR